MDEKVKEYLRQMGRKGGKVTKEKHPEQFSQIGKKGSAIRWSKVADKHIKDIGVDVSDGIKA